MLEMRIGAIVGVLAMALATWLALHIGRPWWYPLPALVAVHVPAIIVDHVRARRARGR